jgi:uroporphyrinogen-III synthase
MAQADAVTLTASSSAEAYAALPASVSDPSSSLSPLAICIGPTTAADALALGLRRVEEAPDPSPEGIVEVLVRLLGRDS